MLRGWWPLCGLCTLICYLYSTQQHEFPMYASYALQTPLYLVLIPAVLICHASEQHLGPRGKKSGGHINALPSGAWTASGPCTCSLTLVGA